MGQLQNTVVHRGVSTLESEKRVSESVDVVAAGVLKIAEKNSDFRMACRVDLHVEQVLSGGVVHLVVERIRFWASLQKP